MDSITGGDKPPPKKKGDMTMNRNYKSYTADIANRVGDYRISVKGFIEWLTDNRMTEKFKAELSNPENSFYDIAYDYSIPVTMVKYFCR